MVGSSAFRTPIRWDKLCFLIRQRMTRLKPSTGLLPPAACNVVRHLGETADFLLYCRVASAHRQNSCSSPSWARVDRILMPFGALMSSWSPRRITSNQLMPNPLLNTKYFELMHIVQSAPTLRKQMVSGTISPGSTPYFSPFPHGTGSLSVILII